MSACETGGHPNLWLGGHGFVKVVDGGSFDSESHSEGTGISNVEWPHLVGRSADAEVRLDLRPFELMIGEEWSRDGPSTDSHLFGLRWYPVRTDRPRGFLELVGKVASDDNGGSSAVDGVEGRFGAAIDLSKTLILDLMIKYGYFDTSEQDMAAKHVTDGGIAVGLRFGF